MGLSPWLLKAIKRKGYRLPTPIQRKAMPLLLQGADVIGMARTGSGKTAAFVVPMLQRLQAHSPRAGARAVVMAPTRELALQVRERGTSARARCEGGVSAEVP
jgi:ATP-dependent RNA helicase DDX54/DBP10